MCLLWLLWVLLKSPADANVHKRRLKQSRKANPRLIFLVLSLILNHQKKVCSSTRPTLIQQAKAVAKAPKVFIPVLFEEVLFFIIDYTCVFSLSGRLQQPRKSKQRFSLIDVDCCSQLKIMRLKFVAFRP